MIQVSEFQNKAQTGFEPVIFGLRDRRLTTWPLRQMGVPYFGNHQLLFSHGFSLIAESWEKKSMAAVGFEPTPPKRLVP